MASFVHPALQLCSQTVAFSHGARSFYVNDVSTVDNPVHNCVANRAVLRGIGIDSLVADLLKAYYCSICCSGYIFNHPCFFQTLSVISALNPMMPRDLS